MDGIPGRIWNYEGAGVTWVSSHDAREVDLAAGWLFLKMLKTAFPRHFSTFLETFVFLICVSKVNYFKTLSARSVQDLRV